MRQSVRASRCCRELDLGILLLVGGVALAAAIGPAFAEDETPVVSELGHDGIEGGELGMGLEAIEKDAGRSNVTTHLARALTPISLPAGGSVMTAIWG